MALGVSLPVVYRDVQRLLSDSTPRGRDPWNAALGLSWAGLQRACDRATNEQSVMPLRALAKMMFQSVFLVASACLQNALRQAGEWQQPGGSEPWEQPSSRQHFRNVRGLCKELSSHADCEKNCGCHPCFHGAPATRAHSFSTCRCLTISTLPFPQCDSQAKGWSAGASVCRCGCDYHNSI